MDMIRVNPDLPWNWYAISRNKKITMDMICDNPRLPWSWNWISMNPNLTILKLMVIAIAPPLGSLNTQNIIYKLDLDIYLIFFLYMYN